MFSGGILALTKRGIALSLWFATKINLSTRFCKSKILLRSVFKGRFTRCNFCLQLSRATRPQHIVATIYTRATFGLTTRKNRLQFSGFKDIICFCLGFASFSSSCAYHHLTSFSNQRHKNTSSCFCFCIFIHTFTALAIIKNRLFVPEVYKFLYLFRLN